MNHESAQEKLESYHDGELSPAEARDVERHLVECAECRLALSFLAKTRRLLTPSFSDQGRFVASVMARVRAAADAKAEPAAFGWFRWFFPLGSVAALAGFALLMVFPVSRRTAPADLLSVGTKTDAPGPDWLLSAGTPDNDQVLSALLEES